MELPFASEFPSTRTTGNGQSPTKHVNTKRFGHSSKVTYLSALITSEGSTGIRVPDYDKFFSSPEIGRRQPSSEKAET